MKFIFVTCSALFLFACAQKQSPAENAGATTPAAAETPAVAASNKLPDPVCEMPYDTSYKEWAVYKTDTLHFCSTTCKGVFEKAPEKYMAKLGK